MTSTHCGDGPHMPNLEVPERLLTTPLPKPLFPRTAIQYQDTSIPNTDRLVGAMEWSRHDVMVHNIDFLISDYEATPSGQETSPKSLKRLNPGMKIYCYFSPVDYPSYFSESMIKLKGGFDPDWFVKSITTRQPVVLYTNPSTGSQTFLMNLSKLGLRRRLLEILRHPALSRDNLIDGIFLDWASSIGWLNTAVDGLGNPRAPGGLDFFDNRIPASEAVIDAAYREAWNELADSIRSELQLGVTGNGGWDSTRDFRVEGFMIEEFMAAGAAPGAWGSWSSIMQCYAYYARDSQLYPASFIMQTTAETPPADSEVKRARRFAVASALMFDGAVCLNSFISGSYYNSFWIDELGVDELGFASKSLAHRRWLGRPLSDAYAVATTPAGGMPAGTKLSEAVQPLTTLAAVEATLWRRDFEGGSVLVLPHSAAMTISSGLSGLKYINGLTDAAVNTGAAVPMPLTMQPKTGLCLFRPLT